MKVVALLESMWGWRGYNEPGEEAPRFFRINPDNFSGRRLYRLCGDTTLIVTNSCKVVQASANHHGTPDPHWVKENISKAIEDGCELLLVCGKVAKETIAASGVQFEHVIYMDHPAARRWTNEKLEEITSKIESRRKQCSLINSEL
jgi:hypothetical protein